MEMNRLHRMHWAGTFTNLDKEQQLIMLVGFYEALEEVLELVDEVMFDTEITDKQALKEVQGFLRQELKELVA
jgi:hypothetical protein